jgi:hypothetical protein
MLFQWDIKTPYSSPEKCMYPNSTETEFWIVSKVWVKTATEIYDTSIVNLKSATQMFIWIKKEINLVWFDVTRIKMFYFQHELFPIWSPYAVFLLPFFTLSLVLNPIKNLVNFFLEESHFSRVLNISWFVKQVLL